MHTVLAVLILAAIVLGINVLTILVNHFLSRGDIHDRLKVLEARLPKASAEPLFHGEEVDWTAAQALGYAKAPEEQPLTPEGISAMLSPEHHDLLRQVVAGAYPDSEAEHMAWYHALHSPGFPSCLAIGPKARCGFILSATGHAVMRILDERREQAELNDAAKRMEDSAARFIQSCQRVEDRLTFLIDALQEQVMRAQVNKKTRKRRAKAT